MLIDLRPTKRAENELKPYLVTLVGGALHHIQLLPNNSRDQLIMTVAHQHSSNNLLCCLVFDDDDVLYFEEEGKIRPSNQIPESDIVVTGKLRLNRIVQDQLEEESNYKERTEALNKYVESKKIEDNTYLFGDLSKGAQKATHEEILALTNIVENDPFRGLKKCCHCGEYFGYCLDSWMKYENMIVRVDCLCINNNRCANCNEFLHPHKLNSNYFNKSDGKIWHTPTFCALSHQCKE